MFDFPIVLFGSLYIKVTLFADENFPTEAWSKMIHHELPDGGILELGAEIHKCTEPLYKPDLIGDNDGPDLLAAVKQAVKG